MSDLNRMPNKYPLIKTATIEEIEKRREESVKKEDIEVFISGLAAKIRDDWQRALEAKIPIEKELLESLRQVRNQYSPSKLAAMRQLYGEDYTPPYMPITSTKCMAAAAWISDVLFRQQKELPFNIEATPQPELPPEVTQSIEQEVVNEIVADYAIQAEALGSQIDMQQISLQVEEELAERLKKEIKKRSNELSKELKTKFRDILHESNWVVALKDVIPDIILKTGFIKGPIYKRRPELKFNRDPYTDRIIADTVFNVTEWYERRSPFNIFPEPGSIDIDDGYLIDLVSFTRKDLIDLKSVPGFSAEAIDRILDNHDKTGLREWNNFIYEKQHITKEYVFNYNKIDGLEYWGCVRGKFLIEHGLLYEDDMKTIPIKENDYYHICAWLIDTEIIKVMLNPDPLGRKPFAKASWINVPGSFWGIGLPEQLKPVQDQCNSIARAIGINAPFASAPLTELNIERLDPTESHGIWPMRIFKVTTNQMQEAPVARFTTPPLIADRLVNVYAYFSKIADEISIPAYAHGSTNVSGAGRTASGLNLIYNAAYRTVKHVIENIDIGIIENTIKRHYDLLLHMGKVDLPPDIKIVATGSSSIIFKEQFVSRLIELYNYSKSPKLLEVIAEVFGIDPELLQQDQEQQYQELLTNALQQNPQTRRADGALYAGKEEKTV